MVHGVNVSVSVSERENVYVSLCVHYEGEVDEARSAAAKRMDVRNEGGGICVVYVVEKIGLCRIYRCAWDSYIVHDQSCVCVKEMKNVKAVANPVFLSLAQSEPNRRSLPLRRHFGYIHPRAPTFTHQAPKDRLYATNPQGLQCRQSP